MINNTKLWSTKEEIEDLYYFLVKLGIYFIHSVKLKHIDLGYKTRTLYSISSSLS